MPTFSHFYAVRGISPADCLLALIFAISSTQLLLLPLPYYTAVQIFFIVIVVIVIVGATVFRRTHVIVSAVTIYIAFLIRFVVLPPAFLSIDCSLLFALYACVAYSTVQIGRIAAFCTIIAGILYWLPFVESEAESDIVVALCLIQAVILAVYAFALVRHYQFRRIEDAVSAAEAKATQLENEAKAAVILERNRIAQDMHDILGHTLTLVIAQADGGRYSVRTHPEKAEQALSTISEISRSALRDVRSLITLLRVPGKNDASPYQNLRPNLEELIATVRATGCDVVFESHGSPAGVPISVSSAIYRICQEALTNCLKHAGHDAHVEIKRSFEPHSVRLEVTDDGSGSSASSDGFGHGLIGMSERAHVLGGELHAGPLPHGGFQVSVSIPFTPNSAEEKLEAM